MREKIVNSEFYSRLAAKRMEFVERKAIGGIQKYNLLGEEWIHSVYRDVKANTKKYLSDLLSSGKWGCFSKSIGKDTLYSYVYIVMLAGLLDVELEPEIKNKIINKLKKAQKADGLFYDSVVMNYQFLNGDGWGARHLVPLMIIALERLHQKPAYEFRFLKPFADYKMTRSLMEGLDWEHVWGTSNLVMNIGVCMQYSRDFMKQECYNDSIKAIQDWLCLNIREEDGMWYQGKAVNKKIHYEMLRGAYHLYPLLIYDGLDFPHKKRAIDLILQMQNSFGGFDFRKNSGACEDIDAVEPLIRLSILSKGYRENEIRDTICRAFFWVVQNQMEDGGFVFRRGERLVCGHRNMSSDVNESNLFATWFRFLSLEYMYGYLTGKGNSLVNVPGYEYPLLKV